jgi:hypothetical protein
LSGDFCRTIRPECCRRGTKPYLGRDARIAFGDQTKFDEARLIVETLSPTDLIERQWRQFTEAMVAERPKKENAMPMPGGGGGMGGMGGMDY